MKRFVKNGCPVKERPNAQLAGRAIYEGTYQNFGADVFKDNKFDNFDPETGEIKDDDNDDT